MGNVGAAHRLQGVLLFLTLLAGCVDDGPPPAAPSTSTTRTPTFLTSTLPGSPVPTAPVLTPISPSPPPGTTTAIPSVTAPPPRISDALRRGDEGPAVLKLQQRLSDLGYWLGTPDGTFGFLTEQGVLAIQGAAGLRRDGVVGARTRAALEDGVRPTPRSRNGRAVEVDRDRGLLSFVVDGSAVRILHTSTGTFERYTVEGRTLLADTPTGTWQVTWAHDGWRTSDLGRLYRPRYFHRDGIAVHGYPSVPAYPASHGCVRVSMDAMDMIWREALMPRGRSVLVF